MSMPARARSRHSASGRRQSVARPARTRAVRGRHGQPEAESVGKLFRRAPRRLGFERVGVDDVDEAVGLDDARFPLVAGDSWRIRPPSARPET